MNPIDQRYRSMGELMTELRVRLGFQAQGTASKNNDLIMKSFLREAHDFIYGELEPPARRKKTTIRLQPGSYLYDWHNDIEDEDIDPGRAIALWLIEADTIRRPLPQGITEYDRALAEQRSAPERYDTLNGQIELYPVPDREYDLVVEYIAEKPRFDQAKDRPGVPDSLVFLLALAKAKAHYNHKDASAQASNFDRMLAREKSRQRENRRYFAGSMQTDCSVGQVVATAAGYAYKP